MHLTLEHAIRQTRRQATAIRARQVVLYRTAGVDVDIEI
jgi:hypothetical protein